MGKMIRRLRVQLNLTQNQLAEVANVSQSTISRLEKNSSRTNYEVIYKIILYLQANNFNHSKILESFLNRNCLEFMSRVMGHHLTRKAINHAPLEAAKLFVASCSVQL